MRVRRSRRQAEIHDHREATFHQNVFRSSLITLEATDNSDEVMSTTTGNIVFTSSSRLRTAPRTVIAADGIRERVQRQNRKKVHGIFEPTRASQSRITDCTQTLDTSALPPIVAHPRWCVVARSVQSNIQPATAEVLYTRQYVVYSTTTYTTSLLMAAVMG